jgi:hypothetical protein
MESMSTVTVLKSSGDVLFLMLGAVMVFAMHAGFAFLEVGTVRKKNQVNALVKILTDWSVSTVVYFLIGFPLAYGISFLIPADELLAKAQGYDLVHFFFLAEAPPVFAVLFVLPSSDPHASKIVEEAIPKSVRYRPFIPRSYRVAARRTTDPGGHISCTIQPLTIRPTGVPDPGAGAEPRAPGLEPDLPYFPTKRGGLFCDQARTPSIKSRLPSSSS